MSYDHTFARPLFLIVCGALLLSGCSRGNPVPTPDQSQFARLGIFYGRFIAQNQGKGPANEAEFKNYLQSVDTNIKLEEFLVSPRDKEPYVILYNVAPAPGEISVVAHEKTGVNGKRMVCLSNSEVRTVDEAGFNSLLAKHP